MFSGKSFSVVSMLALVLTLGVTGFAMAHTEWVQSPHNPVIEYVDLNFGYGNLRVSSVVLDGTTYHMWLTAAVTGSSITRVGHATSNDGVVWTMDPANPVLIPGDVGEWDHDHVVGGGVIHADGEFHMWYTGGSDGTERVGYATSPDGSTWTKHAANPVMEVDASGSWDGAWLRPASVIDDDGTLRMWFSGSQDGVEGGRIGYAESADGITWTTRTDPVLEPVSSPGGTIESGLAGPSVVFDGITYHMWYCDDWILGFSGVSYAFSSDGIEWVRHRENPVLVPTEAKAATASRVLFDGNEWHMWYSHWQFAFPLQHRISYATSDCCQGVVGLDHTLYIPAAALASGAQGSFYQTDVDLSNAGEQPAEYLFVWLPRGKDNSVPVTSGVFTLGANIGARYHNVLSEIFGLEADSFGGLALRSTSPDLLAMSRTYNVPENEAGGTFGQAIAPVRPDEFIRSGERRRILFGTENGDMRTNIGCQNGTGAELSINVQFFGADGASLGTEVVVLQPWSNDQLNRIFRDYAPVTGCVDVWTMTPKGTFFCFGSVLDNVTSDPTTVLPQ